MSEVWFATACCCCLVLSCGTFTTRRTACFTGASRCRASGEEPPGQLEQSELLPDISSLSPELQQEWHVSRNAHFGGIKITAWSSRRAVWECKRCPAGQPHIWSALVRSRSRGTKCPYCMNRDVCLHNSLATVSPQTAKYWNHSQNAKAPHQVLAGSNSRAEWRCPDCKLEWQACIAPRVSRNAGCPRCSLKNGSGRHHPTFEEDKPAVMEDWDYESNAADGIFPRNTTHGSSKLVHWTCKCCPRGQLHRYQATAFSRTQAKPRGCPYCAGKQPCICNSLESLHPSIAAELDHDKNGFSAAEVTAYSNKNVWWRDHQGRSWRQAVCIRTDKRLTQTKRVECP